MIKIHHIDRNMHCDLMKNYHFDEKLLFWWKTIILMKNYYFDQNLSQCRKFITVMKIYYGDENYHQVYQIEGKRSAHEPN